MRVNIRAKVKAPRRETAEITTDFIKLDSLLKFQNLVETGGEAKDIIFAGLVRVDGEVCTARGKKIYPGMKVEARGAEITVVKAAEDES